jgi:hypothetical protein
MVDMFVGDINEAEIGEPQTERQKLRSKSIRSYTAIDEPSGVTTLHQQRISATAAR